MEYKKTKGMSDGFVSRFWGAVKHPIGITLLFKYESMTEVKHSLYDNVDDDQRVTDPEKRSGLEVFDRILVVGRSIHQFKTGMITKKKENILVVLWDEDEEVGSEEVASVDSKKCVMIPYPFEEGRGKISKFYENAVLDVD